MSDETWIIGTQESGLFIADLTKDYSFVNIRKFGDITLTRIASISKVEQGHVIAAFEGIGFVEPKQFKTLSEKTLFSVWGINSNNDGLITYAGAHTVGVLNPVSGEIDEKDFSRIVPENVIEAIETTEGKWCATASGFLYLIKNGELVKKVEGADFTVFSLSEDDDGSIWFNADDIFLGKLNRDGTVKRYSKEDGLEARSIQIKRGPDRNWYALTTEHEELLFVYDRELDRFSRSGMKWSTIWAEFLHDFDIASNGDKYFAVQNGVYVAGNDNIPRRIPFQDFPLLNDLHESRAIALQSDTVLWFTSNFGVVRHSPSGTRVFGRKDGLIGNLYSYRNLLTGRNFDPIVGTGIGLARIKASESSISSSNYPYIRKISADGTEIPLPNNSPASIQFNDIVIVTLASVQYSGTDAFFHYKIDEKPWSVPTKSGEISLPFLWSGNHTISFRTQLATDSRWSSPIFLRVSVVPPIFLEFWFILLVIFLFVFLVWVYSRARLKRIIDENAALEQRIEARTQELILEKQKLQNANDLKARFMGVAAHDLRNPLGIVSNYAEMIPESLDNKDDLLFFSHSIHKATSRMLNIIEELLELNVLKGDELDLVLKELDFGALTDQVVSHHGLDARKKKQELKTEISKNCLVNGAGERLFEVVENLLTNAIKYTPEGGKIHVRVFSVGSESSNKRVRLEIKDTGRGLTDIDKQIVFGRFQKLSAKPTAGESSTGLGLSIVKELVEAHHGKVWVESPGQNLGATFIVELPASKGIQALSGLNPDALLNS